MRLSLSPKKHSLIRQSQRWPWLEISILIMLAAAILRLGGDLAMQWRQAAERIGLVEANLHAKSAADYSTDPLGIFIPPLSPEILDDLLGALSTVWEDPFGLPGGIPGLPGGSGGESPEGTLPSSATQTPTPHYSDPTQPSIGSETPNFTPTEVLSPTPTPTRTTAASASATPTRTAIVNVTPTLSPTQGTGSTPTITQTNPPVTDPTLTPTRIPTRGISPTTTTAVTKIPSHTPTRTSKPSTVTPTRTIQPPSITPTQKIEPTTQMPPPTTEIPPVPNTPTPFATRDPTIALTPTANYTPGGTTAPITPGVPVRASKEGSTCWPVWSTPQLGMNCMDQTSLIEENDGLGLLQTLLDMLGLDFGRGMVSPFKGD